MPKDTSTGGNGATVSKARPEDRAEAAAKTIAEARREVQRLRREAEADAARMRAEAEEHARRLVVDARAAADGVRAEGMELVSHLREMGNALRSNSERLLHDVQAIHSRMIRELSAAGVGGVDEAVEAEEARAAGDQPPDYAAEGEEVLDVPDFVARG